MTRVLHTRSRPIGSVQRHPVADHRGRPASVVAAGALDPNNAGARILGHVVAGLLVVAIALSVFVDVRYGWVARQFELFTASNAGGNLPLAARANHLKSGA